MLNYKGLNFLWRGRGTKMKMKKKDATQTQYIRINDILFRPKKRKKTEEALTFVHKRNV